MARRRLQEEIERVKSESQNFASQYNEEKKKLEERMEKLKKEAETRDAEHNQQMQHMHNQLRRKRRRGFFRKVGRAVKEFLDL